jgi:hypothetical protein
MFGGMLGADLDLRFDEGDRALRLVPFTGAPSLRARLMICSGR